MAQRRQLAIAAFAVLGSGAAFSMGAALGNKLEHQTRAVSVGKVNVTELQSAASSEHEEPAPTPVARVQE